MSKRPKHISVHVRPTGMNEGVSTGNRSFHNVVINISDLISSYYCSYERVVKTTDWPRKISGRC